MPDVGAGRSDMGVGNSVVISIVMPMRNEIRSLPVVLSALKALLDADAACEVIICDNGSTDGTGEMLRQPENGRPRLTVVSTDGTTPSSVRNVGVGRAQGAILAFVDGDCEIADDYTHAIRTVFTEEQIGAAGSWVAMPDNAGAVERTWQLLHEDTASGNVVALNGANLVVRKDAFIAVGGFDESLRTNEDEELCHRLAAASWVIRCDRRIRAVHHGNAKTVSAFYRRALWHSQSIPAMLIKGKIDRGIAALLAHAALLFAAAFVAALGLARRSPTIMLVALMLTTMVPLASVLYRARGRLRARINWPVAVFLYYIFFMARVHGSFVGLLSGGAASWKGAARR